MDKEKFSLKTLNTDLKEVANNFLKVIKELGAPVQIYTHRDADGLSSGAILGKMLYREDIPFQIRVLKQLEKQEIEKILTESGEYDTKFLIFSDFGSGQYLELQKKFVHNEKFHPLLILDHHLPQHVTKMEESKLIEDIHENTKTWHINPYCYGINGSSEISGAGLCYFFSKAINSNNIDLSPLAIVGAIGDIQNQGNSKSFIGVNKLILEDAMNSGLLEVVNDLNFPMNKPLNEAIAYSTEIKLPGLSKDVNRTLIFLKTRGILMENHEGKIKSLSELNQDEKQKISSAIIEYGSLKLDLEPEKIIKKLIVNRYLLKEESTDSPLYDVKTFSSLLNACGRTENASLGIAIAMGDRKESFQEAKEAKKAYSKSLVKALKWIQEEEDKIIQMDAIQYFFGEDVIPESIIGTITSMLIFQNNKKIDKSKPVFGLVKRDDEEVYKVSGRAHEKIVSQGINLSSAIREACKLSSIDVLGGGHPPAAGTIVPIDQVEQFLENCNIAVRNQQKSNQTA
ncbi:MAG: DHH family phosphoesterase [Promethearchaeota archaeon]|jgi:RecJ-like exonuclease